MCVFGCRCYNFSCFSTFFFTCGKAKVDDFEEDGAADGLEDAVRVEERPGVAQDAAGPDGQTQRVSLVGVVDVVQQIERFLKVQLVGQNVLVAYVHLQS